MSNWSFGDFLWAMLVFFFWFMIIWMFIAVFADIFRRHDLSGWGKAGWIILIVFLPLLGILIYLIARPKVPMEGWAAGGEQPRAGSADEIAKAAQLLESGKITQAEYDQLKQRALRS